MKHYPHIYRDYKVPLIRIPINQPGFNGMWHTVQLPRWFWVDSIWEIWRIRANSGGGFSLCNCTPYVTTVDGRSPANQLRLVVYPIIYDLFHTSKRWLFGISAINSTKAILRVFSWKDGDFPWRFVSWMEGIQSITIEGKQMSEIISVRGCVWEKKLCRQDMMSNGPHPWLVTSKSHTK